MQAVYICLTSVDCGCQLIFRLFVLCELLSCLDLSVCFCLLFLLLYLYELHCFFVCFSHRWTFYLSIVHRYMHTDFVCTPLFFNNLNVLPQHCTQMVRFCLNIVHKWWGFASILYTSTEVLPQHCEQVAVFYLFFFFFGLGSHLPWSKNWSEVMLHFWEVCLNIIHKHWDLTSILYISTEILLQYCTQVLKFCVLKFCLRFCFNIVHKYWDFAPILYTSTDVLPQYCTQVLRFCCKQPIVNRKRWQCLTPAITKGNVLPQDTTLEVILW